MHKKNLGLVFFPAIDWMISETHPERQERLIYTYDQLMEEGILDLPNIKEYKPEMASMKDIQRTHICIPNEEKIVTDAHLASVGGAIVAAEAVLKKQVERSFALVRPPGHHAMKITHGIRGFCSVNIEAIMVDYIRQHYGIERIAIVDTDVHHGDGTQDVFYHDPNTLFISFHQDGRTLYPGSGFTNELGSPYAFLSNINLPLLPGTGDEGIHLLYDGLISHILEDFKPELIINSAGQDNHFTDQLAAMQVTAKGYAELTKKLNADIAVLEGGYSIETALPYINTGIVLAMAGYDYSKVIEPDQRDLRGDSERTIGRVKELIENMGKIWKYRDVLKKETMIKAGSVWQREKPIYYDTDGIQENQIETAYYCSSCSGYLTIATDARGTYFNNQSAFIGIVWRDSCHLCEKNVYDAVNKEKKKNKHDYYFVQNRKKDILERI